MRNFKRVLLSVVCVLLVFCSLSVVIMEPYLRSETQYYQDSRLRDELAGTIDFVSIGASNSLCALDTQVIDQELDVSSYNLSGSLMTLKACQFMLRKELERNPIHTVVIDVSYETLTRDSSDEKGEGDSVTFARLSSLGERMKFLISCVPLDDWSSVYAYHFIPESLEYFLGLLTGAAPAESQVDDAAKGFLARKAKDFQLTPEEATELFEQETLNTDFRRQNIRELEEMMELCKDAGVQVILAAYPRTDSNMWKVTGQDTFREWMEAFSREYGCNFYDFNLLKSRNELFNDHESFYDEQHMSAEGADVFTEVFCDILCKSETEDVSQYFYPSYEAMKVDSPYMAYLP